MGKHVSTIAANAASTDVAGGDDYLITGNVTTQRFKAVPSSRGFVSKSGSKQATLAATGIVFPEYSQTEMNAMQNIVAKPVVFNTTVGALQQWNGTAWVTIGSSSNGSGNSQGAPGVGISSAAIDLSGNLIITYTDGSTDNVGNVKGPQGTAGPTGATGANGSNGTNGVSVTNAVINGSSHLIIYLSNGNTIDAGVVGTVSGISSAQSNVVSTATNYPISTSDFGTNGTLQLFVDASGGDVNIPLVTAAQLFGKEIWIIKTDASPNVVNLNPQGSETINGYSSLQLTAQNQSATLLSDNQNIFTKYPI